MHRIFKRTLAVLLAASLMVCVFASCKKDDQDTEPITQGNQNIIAPETTTTEPTSAESTVADTTTTTAPVTQPIPAGPSGNTGGKTDQEIANQSGLTLNFVDRLIRALGFSYDAKEGVFYTEVDSWQRSANYIQHYDMLAPLGNMRYLTVKTDFDYAMHNRNLNWRFQLWKGQYGPFGGAEIGVYYKYPGQTEQLYYCADDEKMLLMEYNLYLTPADYYINHVFFRRPWQKHWWLTGFKAATVNPENLVMEGRMRMLDGQMRKAAIAGFEAAGFREGDAKSQMDTYRVSGFDIYFLWHQAGATNYQ